MGFKAVPMLPLLKEEDDKEVSVSFWGYEEGCSGNEFKHGEIIALLNVLCLICKEEKKKRKVFVLCA